MLNSLFEEFFLISLQLNIIFLLPVVLASLFISFLQTIFQLQDSSLSQLFKLASFILVAYLAGDFCCDRILEYFDFTFAQILNANF
jgi:flagellar biosynthesis protein FliQ